MTTYRFSYVFEIDTPDPVRVWTGHGRLVVDGTTYLGTGDLISLPDLKQLINGIAERLEVTLSGVTDEALKLIEQERLTFPLSAARLGRVSFDADWQVSGSIEYLWEGEAETMEVKSALGDLGRERVLTVTFGNGNTRRSDPQLRYFTDRDQRRRSADDSFFVYTGQISNGSSRTFGPK